MTNSRRYIISLCQFVINYISHTQVSFCYVPDTVVHNDFNDVRSGCSCNSGKPHCFGYIYCCRHLELIENLFSFDVCRRASEICCHNRLYKAACVNCYNYYKFFYFSDDILICLRLGLIDTLLLSDCFIIFVYIDNANFLQHCRKFRNEQQGEGNQ